jgi:hypothetical protein
MEKENWKFIVYWTWQMQEKPITKLFHIALQFAMKTNVLKNLNALVRFMVFILWMLELVPSWSLSRRKGIIGWIHCDRDKVCLWQEKVIFKPEKIWFWGIQKDFKIRKWPKLARNLKKVKFQITRFLQLAPANSQNLKGWCFKF